MRYYEFIMEYKTQITKGNYGQKILDKIGLPTIVQRKAFPPNMYENDYTMGALDLMDTPRINPIDNSHNIENITLEDYNEHKDEIVDWLLQQFEYFDPTPNKQYTQQIVKWFLSDNLAAFPSIEDGLSTLKESLYYFQKMKARLPEDYRDIAQYTSAKNFMASVQHFRDEYGKKEELPKGEYKKIYESEFGTAYWPMDQEAACYLGQGTQWCTAATYSDNYFDHYNEVGGLIIINLNKEVKLVRSKTAEDSELYVTKVQAYVRPDEDVRNIWGVEEITNQQDVEIEPYMLDPTYNGSNDLIKLWHDDKFQEAARKVAEHYRPKDWGME